MLKQHRPSFLSEGFIFPESPRWHRGFFYCTSIDEGTIYKVHQDGSKEVFLKIDDRLSGWVFTSPGSDEIVVTSVFKRKLLWRENKDAALEEIADLTNFATHGLNDLVRSESGIIFVASVNFEFDKTELHKAPNSPLIRVDSDGSVSVASDETKFANGMVITPDGKRLIVADSLLFLLHQWNLAEDGTLSKHSTFAKTPGSMPDGICMDAEGGVWVAAGYGGVFRVLEGGKVTDKIVMNSTAATACMLGGEDGRTLLITASDSYDRKVMHKNPSGQLFTVRVAVAGVSLPSWY